MELTPGTVVECRYTVIGPVKRGGMGRSTRSWTCARRRVRPQADARTGRSGDPTPPSLSADSERRCGFSAVCATPDIPRVLDFNTKHEDCLCIVMDFVEGENLEQLRDQTAVPASFVLDVAEQVPEHHYRYLHQEHPASAAPGHRACQSPSCRRARNASCWWISGLARTVS